MTFRVEDLTVSLLPERYEIEDAAACTKCTKCTAKTGPMTDCTGTNQGDCCGTKKSEHIGVNEIEVLRAQMRAALEELAA